jgi:predicted glycogen debranching enzyme
VELQTSLEREWLETNGLGGFASSTICGLNTRRYHGLLTAATKPPVGRIVLLSKLEETLIVDGTRYDLSANRYPAVIHPRGFEHLKEFTLDPVPTFTYEADGVSVRKSVFMVHGENTTVVQYEITGNATLEVRALIAFRDYHSLTRANAALDPAVSHFAGRVVVRPYADLPELHLAHDADAIDTSGCWYYNFEYDRERERGLDAQEDLFSPCVFRFENRARCTIIASTDACRASSAPSLLANELRRRSSTGAAPIDTPLVRRLVRAADQYIVRRGSFSSIIAGYHWFSDWGRDTMIALPGLTLVTGRFDVARDILLAFAGAVDMGMLPNRFPDAGETPEYNTVDATLWFFEAVRAYTAYSGDVNFVLDNLYAKLKDIVEWHLKGTRYGISVDEDGLLRCGAPGSQLTWMDVKIGDWVVTPRHGKPVEVQALWYNALRIMQNLAAAAGDEARELFFRNIADLARESFRTKFWNDELSCLYDCINGNERDASIRPNQIFAVSLAHPLLEGERAWAVVEAVREHLRTPMGLRTLAPWDPAYRPRYKGGVFERDSAYHQGTVWPWLLGPFITAYVKVHDGSAEARETALSWAAGVESHLDTACLGHISEIADAEAPHTPRGCVAQAWSVAEILRAVVEDVYQIRTQKHVAAVSCSGG